METTRIARKLKRVPTDCSNHFRALIFPPRQKFFENDYSLLFFDQRFTDSTLPILYRPSYPRKEKEREIQTRPREKSVFGREGAGEREGEIKWNAKLNLVGLESRRGPSLKNVSRAGRAVVRVNDSNRDNEATMPKEQWVMDVGVTSTGLITGREQQKNRWLGSDKYAIDRFILKIREWGECWENFLQRFSSSFLFFHLSKRIYRNFHQFLKSC